MYQQRHVKKDVWWLDMSASINIVIRKRLSDFSFPWIYINCRVYFVCVRACAFIYRRIIYILTGLIRFVYKGHLELHLYPTTNLLHLGVPRMEWSSLKKSRQSVCCLEVIAWVIKADKWLKLLLVPLSTCARALTYTHTHTTHTKNWAQSIGTILSLPRM